MTDILQKVENFEKRCISIGFTWPNEGEIVKQIKAEGEEILAAINTQESAERLQEEVGDLLHAALSLCIFCGFEPKQTLEKTMLKLEKRLNHIEQQMHARDLKTLNGLAYEDILKLWTAAKGL
jgi:uncharacterized protein YabN with tetrapyrrole methylase and pyrophosphatase domain